MKASLTNIACLLLAAASTNVAAQSIACVKECATSNPTSSFCDGNETGTALSTCTCQTLQNSALLKCIKSKCSSADQTTYASNLPQPCGASLFPGLSLSGSSTPSGSPSQTNGGTTPTSSTGGTQGSSTPASTSKPGAANGLVAPAVMLAAGPLVAAALL